ncbi:DNA ligase (ATP) [Physocladia obscura]|uniref:DNA ligase n=1 Tax=Physocladia obscura TaxID=109957 RepID=A0AAD5T8C2_9FUNG|nr:DNA ligase (ATP) [Physocladia obscura]
MSLPFSLFAKELDRIQRTKGHSAKKAIVALMLRDRQDAETVLALLLPHLDQRVLQIKDKVLARIYVDALGIEGTTSAARLLDWRNPAFITSGLGDPALSTVDFAQSLYSVIRDRISSLSLQSQPLTVRDNSLDRKTIISFFVANLNPTEHKWLSRIILKEMKLGITEKTVFDAWHKEAQDLYNITSSLSRVAKDLIDPNVSVISNSSVSLNFPFKPMLAKSVKSLDSVEKLRQGKAFWIETKLDGERMQLHKSGSNYKWFSRNAKDYTNLYGAYKDQKLARHIHVAFLPTVDTCVLDGEMMSFNVSTSLFESFGNLKTAANLFNADGETATSKPVYIAFDILLYNNKSLLESPLRDRRKLLSMILKDSKGRIEILSYAEGNTTEDVVKALDSSMMRREEGIVVKNPDSDYLLNDRAGEWLKVKPDYIDSLGDDLDLVLVGGFFGSGYRSGKLSHFMCAVIDDSSPPDQRRYITFCKFGSGYKEDQIEEISHESEGHWQAYDHVNPPAWFIHPPTSKERPNMIIHPSHARVVTVKAAEVVESTQYGSGYTLRFPRFVTVRQDKDVGDGLSKTELEEYIHNNEGRMQSRRFGGGDGGDFDGKGKRDSLKKVSRRFTAAVVRAEYQGVKVERNEKLDEIFKGMEFCVIPGAVINVEGECLKHELEREIMKHGGTCVQNPQADSTTCVIADKILLKVANLMKEKVRKDGTKEKLFDIVKAEWVLACIDSKERLPFEPRYMLFASNVTKKHFKKVNDKFGDSFTRDVTVDSLRELFESLPPRNFHTTKRNLGPIEEIETRQKQSKIVSEIEHKYGLETNIARKFRNFSVYLDLTDTIFVSSKMLGAGTVDVNGVVVVDDGDDQGKDKMMEEITNSDYNSVCMLEPEILSRGGQVETVLGPWTTHIVIGSAEVDYPIRTVKQQQEREQLFLKLLLFYPQRHLRRPNIVSTLWVKSEFEN